MKVLVAALASIGLVATPSSSEACSPRGNQPFMLEPAHAGDTTPPTPITVCDWFVTHFKGGGTCGDPRGTVHIFPDSTDDATPAEDLGYRFHIVGEPDDTTAVKLESGALLVDFDGRLPAVDFRVSITPVDLNGNEGKTMRCHVEWTNPEPLGDDGGGCTSTRGSGWLAGLAVAFLAVRRRRQLALVRVTHLRQDLS